VLKNEKSRFIRLAVVAVGKQFVLINLNVCGVCFAACLANAPIHIFICGLSPSAVAFTLFQTGSSYEKIKQRIEYASWVLSKLG